MASLPDLDVLDDDAGQAVVKAGTFRPVGVLDALDGGDMFGEYVLSMADATQDPLAFFSARLDIDSTADVPEPGGLGLLGLWFWRNKKVVSNHRSMDGVTV